MGCRAMDLECPNVSVNQRCVVLATLIRTVLFRTTLILFFRWYGLTGIFTVIPLLIIYSDQ